MSTAFRIGYYVMLAISSGWVAYKFDFDFDTAFAIACMTIIGAVGAESMGLWLAGRADS